MVNQLQKYRIYCIDETVFKYTYGTTAPTVCPTNGSHSINPLSISTLQTISARSVLAEHSPFQTTKLSVYAEGGGTVSAVLPPASRSNGGALVFVAAPGTTLIVSTIPGGSIDAGVVVNDFAQFNCSGSWAVAAPTGASLPSSDSLPQTTADSDIITDDGMGSNLLQTVTGSRVIGSEGGSMAWRPPAGVGWTLTNPLPIGSNGGDFVSGAWHTRELTDVKGNLSDGSVVLVPGTGAFSLTAEGKYLVHARCCASQVGLHLCRLVSDPLMSVVATSTSADSPASATLSCVVDVTSPPLTLLLQHRCTHTRLLDGMGKGTGWSAENFVNLTVSKLW